MSGLSPPPPPLSPSSPDDFVRLNCEEDEDEGTGNGENSGTSGNALSIDVFASSNFSCAASVSATKSPAKRFLRVCTTLSLRSKGCGAPPREPPPPPPPCDCFPACLRFLPASNAAIIPTEASRRASMIWEALSLNLILSFFVLFLDIIIFLVWPGSMYSRALCEKTGQYTPLTGIRI